MKIEFDTSDLSDLDRQVLIAVVETINSGKAPSGPLQETVVAEQPAKTPKRQPKKDVVLEKADDTAAQLAAEQAAEAPTSEEAGDTGEDLLAPADPATPEAPAQPTMQDAVAAATPLISGGKANEVKAVLTELGVSRVSGLSEDQIPAFLAGIKNL